jgi:hypothetical protein
MAEPEISVGSIIAQDLASWVIGKLAEYITDKVSASAKKELGIKADDYLLKKIDSELQEVAKNQVEIKMKVGSQILLIIRSSSTNKLFLAR